MRLTINKISVALGFLVVLQPAIGKNVLEYIESTKEGSKDFSLKPKYRDFADVNLEEIFSSGAYGLEKKEGYAKMKTLKSSKKKNHKSKRDNGYDSIDLDYEKVLYSIPIQIGSDKQKATVQVDTGSSDLWVIGHDWDCKDSGFKCITDGFFDPSKSSSFVKNDTFFNISYLAGYGAQGYYGFDTVIIGDDIELSDFPFAVAENSTTGFAGIFGIGLPHGESLFAYENETYENFAFQLVKNGITESASYSIALAALDDNSHGSDFLLGAVDHSKYSGDFLRFPISPIMSSSNLLYAVSAMLNELYVGAAASIDDDNNIDAIVKAPIYSGSFPVIFDIGSTVCSFPQKFIDGIAYQFGFTYDSPSGLYYRSCSDIGTDYFVGINVQGLDLTVPLYFLLEDLELSNGDKTCVLRIDTADMFILGDNFLRGLYMSVDLQNNELAVGNSNLNPNSTSSDEDIEVISDTIPASTNELYSSTEIQTNGTFYLTSESLTTYSTGFPIYYTDLYEMTYGGDLGDNSNGDNYTYSSRDDGFTNATGNDRFTRASETESGNSETRLASNSQSAMTTTEVESTNGNGATTATLGGMETTSSSSSSHSSSNAGSSVTIKYSAFILMLANFLI